MVRINKEELSKRVYCLNRLNATEKVSEVPETSIEVWRYEGSGNPTTTQIVFLLDVRKGDVELFSLTTRRSTNSENTEIIRYYTDFNKSLHGLITPLHTTIIE